MNDDVAKKKCEDAHKAYTSGNYADAVSAYSDLAESGYSNCQLFLGELFYYGKHIEQDSAKAVYWLGKAAENEEAVAQFLLGKLSAEKANYTEAYHWYEKASNQGYAPAIYKMGLYQEKGRLGIVNKNKARQLYREAAKKGYVYAMRTLGLRLITGSGGILGLFEGVMWLFKMVARIFKIGHKNDWDSEAIRT